MKLVLNKARIDSVTFPVFKKGLHCRGKVSLHVLHQVINGSGSRLLNDKWELLKAGIITKRSLPTIVVGGTCQVGQRCQIKNMTPTGLMVFDVDSEKFNVHQVKKEFAKTIDTTFVPLMCFISPSGRGLKFIIYPKYISNSNFSETHKMYVDYIVNNYKWPIALKGQSNINRKTYLAIDTEVFYNQDRFDKPTSSQVSLNSTNI